MPVAAIPTLLDPTSSRAVDERLGDERLWSVTSTADVTTPVLPDLSIDLLWPTEGRPRVLSRTIETFSVRGHPGQTTCGIRFAPAVLAVDVDWTWPGWADAPTALRPSRLREAVGLGVVRVIREPRVDLLLAALDHPDARVGTIADALGSSSRQLRRWSRTTLGLTPKQLHRRLRLLRFVYASGGGHSLAHRAFAAGYCDQAHASNDIPTLAGIDAASLGRWTMADSSKTAEAQR